MNNDLISRSALKKAIRNPNDKRYLSESIISLVFERIDNAPTVEYTFEEAFQKTVCENKLYCPNKRQKGEWVFVQYDANPNIGNWHCSECRFIARSSIEHLLFCPNCGAKMKGNEDGHDNNLF